jgi:hypothetical protein
MLDARIGPAEAGGPVERSVSSGNGWRVALIDSCGERHGSLDAAGFVSDGRRVERRAPGPDPTNHGTRIAELLAQDRSFELLLGQVFVNVGPTSGATVAAAIDWAVERGAGLIHLSLGLANNRVILETAVARAVAAGCIVVAASPARGAPVFPAAYPGVIRATGDARCGPGEVSHLGVRHFGGCPRFESVESGGASVGAAWVTHAILKEQTAAQLPDVLAALGAHSKYFGPENRSTG